MGSLHPAILECSKAKMDSGDFNGAIFDATCLLEVKLQELSNPRSGAVGTTLTKDVFDKGLLQLSRKGQRNKSAQLLYEGFFGFIRGDRAHWTSSEVKVELSCPTKEVCEWYLGCASLLLYFLEERNLAMAPEILSINPVSGSVLQLKAKNGSRVTTAKINGQDAQIVQQDDEQIEIQIPLGVTSGNIELESRELKSGSKDFVIAPASQQQVICKVIAEGLTLFEDAECTRPRPDVKAILVEVYEPARTLRRSMPTKENYRVGDYITHKSGDWNMQEVCDESWYIDPLSGNIRYAWTGAALYKSTPIGRQGVLKPVKLQLRPQKIVTQKNEIRRPRVLLSKSDGFRTTIDDVTSTAEWKVDRKIAQHRNYAIQSGALCTVKIQCNHSGLHDESTVEVVNIPRFQPVEYFSGIRRLQDCRYDSKDNLFISHQSSFVSLLKADGTFIEEIIKIHSAEDNEIAISHIALDGKDNLLVSCRSSPSGFLYKFLASENYEQLHTIWEGDFTPKGITTDSQGIIYVGTGGNRNRILRFSESGTQLSDLNTNTSPLLVRVWNDKIATASAGGGNTIGLYSLQGELIREFNTPLLSSGTDVAWRNGFLYAVGFRSKNVVRIDVDSGAMEQIVALPGIPGGIDFDSESNMIVSIFDSDAIFKIYMS